MPRSDLPIHLPADPRGTALASDPDTGPGAVNAFVPCVAS